MAHLYFHIPDRDKLIVDEEGLELRDLATAHLEAIKASLERPVSLLLITVPAIFGHR